jgi:hypothetical protein
MKQFGILPLQVAVWYPVTASGSLVSCYCKLQFGILPLQQGNSTKVGFLKRDFERDQK